MQRLLHIQLDMSEVPEHLHLRNILALVRHHACQTEAPELSSRHLKYCEHSARVLGWFDELDQLTPKGREVAHLSGGLGSTKVLGAIASHVAATPVMQAWMRWKGVASLHDLDPADALLFVEECTTFKASTAKKRSNALAEWLRTVSPPQLALPSTGATPPMPPGSVAPHNETPGESAWAHIIGDLEAARTLHILTGYASVERMVLAAAATNAGRIERLRFHVGHEPYAGRQESARATPAALEREVRDYWLHRSVSLFNAKRWLDGVTRLDMEGFEARIGAANDRMVHAKVVVTDATVVTGSSNFTLGGLYRNHEVNARWDTATDEHPTAVRDLAEAIWNRGQPFTDEFRALARQLLRAVTWQEALARACAAILEGEWARDLLPWDELESLSPPLWPHQLEGIRRVLWLSEAMGLVLIADPAGSGKTRLGAWAFRALDHLLTQRGGGRARHPVVICPKAVVASWRRDLTDAGIAVHVFPDSVLSSQGEEAELLEKALARTDFVLLDEAHRYLNSGAKRTRALLAAGPEHMLAFTATPLNRDATDFWGLMDLLGPDHFSEEAVRAVHAIRRADHLSNVRDDIDVVREAFRGCLIRRTRSELVDRATSEPAGYAMPEGRAACYPKMSAEWYELGTNPDDERVFEQIRARADTLTGIHRLPTAMQMTPKQVRLGWTSQRFLNATLSAGAALARYHVFVLLRSSSAAVYAHIHGTASARDKFRLPKGRSNDSGDVLATISGRAGSPPRWLLEESAAALQAPAWLTDTHAHSATCEREAATYREIARLVMTLSDARERRKAALLAELGRDAATLAFDHHVLTLEAMAQRLRRDHGVTTTVVTGTASKSERQDVLRAFGRDRDQPGIALLSDALNEGVNLQGARVVVHLDWPTVIRVAEQRTGRIDRMDSRHAEIRVLWPRERGELSLDGSERALFRRNGLIDKTIGANLPLPDDPGQYQPEDPSDFDEAPPELDGDSAARVADEDADGALIDAFSPVRGLVGSGGLLPTSLYNEIRDSRAQLSACVSVFASASPWAFFCVRGLGHGAPSWVLFPDADSGPVVGLGACAVALRERLSENPPNVELRHDEADWLERFARRLDEHPDAVLPRRDQHVLKLVRDCLDAYAQDPRSRRDVARSNVITELRERLSPGPNCGDLRHAAREFWRVLADYRVKFVDERLRRREVVRTDRLLIPLLEDPIPTKTLEGLCRELAPTAPPSERALAAIVGVPRVG